PWLGHRAAHDDVLLTMNLAPQFASLCLMLAATGARHSIKLRDWPSFLAGEPLRNAPHEVERRALDAVMPRLRALGADPDALLARAVFPKLAPVPGELARKEELLGLHLDTHHAFDVWPRPESSANGATPWRCPLTSGSCLPRTRPTPACGCSVPRP